MNVKSTTARIARIVLPASMAAAMVLVLVASPAQSAWQAAKYNSDGELLMPKDYRQWVFVGAPVTPNDMNNGAAVFPEFHHVYIDKASCSSYAKKGVFPNGTVLVKELVKVGAKSAPSGNGYFPGDFVGVAVAVKDAKRFAKEPGNWAYFSFIGEGGKALASAKAQPTAGCNECHQKNGAEDWVFTQFYPVLRAAKKAK